MFYFVKQCRGGGGNSRLICFDMTVFLVFGLSFLLDSSLAVHVFQSFVASLVMFSMVPCDVMMMSYSSPGEWTSPDVRILLLQRFKCLIYVQVSSHCRRVLMWILICSDLPAEHRYQMMSLHQISSDMGSVTGDAERYMWLSIKHSSRPEVCSLNDTIMWVEKFSNIQTSLPLQAWDTKTKLFPNRKNELCSSSNKPQCNKWNAVQILHFHKMNPEQNIFTNQEVKDVILKNKDHHTDLVFLYWSTTFFGKNRADVQSDSQRDDAQPCGIQDERLMPPAENTIRPLRGSLLSAKLPWRRLKEDFLKQSCLTLSKAA